MKHSLPELPYATDAFSPLITGEGFDYHHGKLHQIYVKNRNDRIRDSSLAERDLVSLGTHAWEKKMCPCPTRPSSISIIRFIEGFWDVVNWDFANRNLKKAEHESF